MEAIGLCEEGWNSGAIGLNSSPTCGVCELAVAVAVPVPDPDPGVGVDGGEDIGESMGVLDEAGMETGMVRVVSAESLLWSTSPLLLVVSDWFRVFEKKTNC